MAKSFSASLRSFIFPGVQLLSPASDLPFRGLFFAAASRVQSFLSSLLLLYTPNLLNPTARPAPQNEVPTEEGSSKWGCFFPPLHLKESSNKMLFFLFFLKIPSILRFIRLCTMALALLNPLLFPKKENMWRGSIWKRIYCAYRTCETEENGVNEQFSHHSFPARRRRDSYITTREFLSFLFLQNLERRTAGRRGNNEETQFLCPWSCFFSHINMSSFIIYFPLVSTSPC